MESGNSKAVRRIPTNAHAIFKGMQDWEDLYFCYDNDQHYDPVKNSVTSSEVDASNPDTVTIGSPCY